MSGGRPSTFTDEIADAICEALADGRSLRSICSAPDMPDKATVFRWLGDEKHSSFRDRYARAREAQADSLFDDILDIADETKHDTVKGANGDDIPNSEWITRSRLRIDARKWMAGKLRPKVYGDKIELEHSGEAPPIAITLIRQPDEGSDGA